MKHFGWEMITKIKIQDIFYFKEKLKILLMYLLKELNENPSLNVFYIFLKFDGFNKMKV